LASTGVIGEPLDATKFNGVLDTLANEVSQSEWISAAKAIMTTDTFPKVATATVKLGKASVTINGMAKGAGMIAPDMATMLSFIFTDAPITAGALQSLKMKDNIVAMSGAIMPAPLAMPLMVTLALPSLTVAVATFGKVSVVMIAL